jgi:CheY-like chemotaxis protein
MPPVILAVEDNTVTGQALAREFGQSGFEVHVTESAEDAFALLEGGLKCDLMILDFNLPVEQGPEFYRRLGMDPKYAKIPIIPFTSQFESSSATSTSLTSQYASSVQADQAGRDRSPIVSKGLSDEVGRIPASLYVAVAEQMGRRGIPKPALFTQRMREALDEVQN